jgi:hypothetical protein
MADVTFSKPKAPDQVTFSEPVAPEQHISVYHESLWERFKDHVDNAVREGQAPGVNQGITYLTGKLTGNPDDAINSEKDYRQQYEAQAQDDPWYKSKDGAFPTGMAAVAGDVVGGATNPLNYIGGGSTRLIRAGKQAAISAASDVANQGMSLAQGVQDKFSASEAALAGLVGGIFGAASKSHEKAPEYGSGGVDDAGDLNPNTYVKPTATEGVPQGATDVQVDGSGHLISFRDPATGRLTVNIEEEPPTKGIESKPIVVFDKEKAKLTPAEQSKGYLQQQGVDNADSLPDEMAIQMHQRLDGTDDIVEKRAIVDTLNHLTTPDESIQNEADKVQLPVLAGSGSGGKPPVPTSGDLPALDGGSGGSGNGNGGGIDGGAIPPNGGGDAPETGKGKYAGNINLERLSTSEEEDDILRQAATHLKLDNQTNSETIDKAREILSTKTPAEIILHDPKASEATEHALALRTTLVSATRRMNESAERILDTSINSEDEFQRLQLLRVTVAAAAEKTSRLAGQAGRLLNQFNIIAGDDHKGVAEAMKNLDEMVGQRVDPKTFAQALLAHRDNQAAQAQIARDSFKPHWEDYGLSLWYNAMLSGPWTHIRNMAGNAISGAQDIIAHAGGAVIGTGRRALGASEHDVTTWGELGQMMVGAYHALVDSGTYSNTRKAFQQGANLGIKGELHHANLSDLVQGQTKKASLTHRALDVLSTPTKALEAEDEFWRNIFTSSKFYGEAHAQAKKEGLSGQDYSDRVAYLVQNPTKKMDEVAEEYAKRLQFRDLPGWLGRLANYARSGVTKGKNTAVDRTVKTIATIIMPFSRVTDNTIRHVIRYSPLGFADRTNLEGFRAGGKRRDIAIARMATGTAALAFILGKVADGTLTGDGPDDYRKKAEMQAEGWQPNSVKVNGKYYSLNGLAPVANQVNILANLHDHYKAGKFTDADYLSNTVNTGRDFIAQLNNNNFTQDIGNLFTMLGQGPQAEGAAKMYLGNLASSVTTPAILRQAEQTFGDTGVQDLTGNGTVGDYVKNRAFQYYGKDLPQKYDSLGNPVLRNEGGAVDRAIGQVKPEASDPAVKELSRLSLKDRALITPAPKTIDRDGYKVKLDSEEYEKYQFMSGQNFMNNLRLRMKSPDWSKLSDSDKRTEVRSMMKDARSDARDSLQKPGWSYVD